MVESSHLSLGLLCRRQLKALSTAYRSGSVSQTVRLLVAHAHRLLQLRDKARKLGADLYIVVSDGKEETHREAWLP